MLEAAGHNGEDVKVWEDNFKDAFVKSTKITSLFMRRSFTCSDIV